MVSKRLSAARFRGGVGFALAGSLIISVLVQTGCRADRDLAAAQYEFGLREEHLIKLERLSERTPDVQRAILTEEEKIITLAATLYSLTGKDAQLDYIHGSGPYNAYLVIAKRTPLSVIFQSSQRTPNTDDLLRQVPDVISVKFVRQVGAEEPAKP
jgi:hypothetical protein